MIHLEYFLENGLEKRIELARLRAKNIYYGNPQSLEDEIFRLRNVLRTEYNIPIFSEYFDKRTLDELIFEVELIVLSKSTPDDKMKDAVKEMNKAKEKGEVSELDSLFDDMDEERKPQKPKPVPMPSNGEPLRKKPDTWVPVSSSPVSPEITDKAAEEFFKTGKFKGEE